ncbi:hypothetical protein MJO29_009703 [Puccinia striiformis f. sp. tritici]|nr:hypothetical protein MJO29_009703 [Puccinia striiformis f. sp. tritici]
MVSTIEKVVNQGVSDEDHRPDSWTAVTKDGRRSAQFEETWLKTSNGTEHELSDAIGPFSSAAGLLKNKLDFTNPRNGVL